MGHLFFCQDMQELHLHDLIPKAGLGDFGRHSKREDNQKCKGVAIMFVSVPTIPQSDSHNG